MKSPMLKRLAAAVSGVAVLAFAAPASAQTLYALLNGANETPLAGDPDGSGAATVRLSNGNTRLCYSIGVRNIAPATLAHIHLGPPGVAGPIVVHFTPPTFGAIAGCTTISATLGNAILANPEQYYVNVHNAPFPAGAVRGQLFSLGGQQQQQ